MRRFRSTHYMLAGAALLLFLLFAGGSFIPGLGSPPVGASALNCEEINYVGVAPDVPEGSVAFGLSIETRVTDFSSLKGEDLVNAVKKDENMVGCQYASQAYTQAIHRGILPWPNSDEEWATKLLEISGNRQVHLDLMAQVQLWNSEASAEVIYLDESYNSDWLVRTGYGPFLRQGSGHDDVAGWVIRWTHVNADGTTSVVTERLTCMYQWVGEVPPGVPPCDCTPPPPCECPPPPSTTTTTQPPCVDCGGTTTTTTTTVPCNGVVKNGVCEHPPASPTIPSAPSSSGTTVATIGPSPTAPPDPVPTGPVHTVDPPVSTNPTSVGGNTGSSIPVPPPATQVTTPPATIPPGTVVSD